MLKAFHEHRVVELHLLQEFHISTVCRRSREAAVLRFWRQYGRNRHADGHNTEDGDRKWWRKGWKAARATFGDAIPPRWAVYCGGEGLGVGQIAASSERGCRGCGRSMNNFPTSDAQKIYIFRIFNTGTGRNQSEIKMMYV